VPSLSVCQRLASAAAVFCGRHGDVTRLAGDRGVFRQTLYREADAAARALDPAGAGTALADLRRLLAAAQAEQARLQRRLRQALVVDAGKQAEFVGTAQALGVSLSSARALLAVLLGPAAPSVGGGGARPPPAARPPPPRRRWRRWTGRLAPGPGRWPPTRSSSATGPS
jgi:hypothetical protein